MLEDIQISPLANVPEMLETISQWTYGEWGKFDKNNSLEATRARFRERMNTETLPIAYVAHKNKEVLGCACIKETDLVERYPNKKYWIGSMFIGLEFRNLGIGSLLMKHLIDKAPSFGATELNLWTGEAETFYAKHGFKSFDRFRYLNQDIVVMDLKLG